MVLAVFSPSALVELSSLSVPHPVINHEEKSMVKAIFKSLMFVILNYLYIMSLQFALFMSITDNSSHEDRCLYILHSRCNGR